MKDMMMPRITADEIEDLALMKEEARGKLSVAEGIEAGHRERCKHSRLVAKDNPGGGREWACVDCGEYHRGWTLNYETPLCRIDDRQLIFDAPHGFTVRAVAEEPRTRARLRRWLDELES